MSRFLHTLLRTVQRHKDRSSHRSATTIHDYSRLEKRELFSAAPVDLDPDLIHSDSQPDFDLADADHHSHSPAGWDALSDHGLDVALDLASIDFLESPQQEVTQLVVIDSRVDDINQLVADIENAGSREIDLLVLNAEEDGIEKITDKLRELSSLSAVHVISHGDSDTVLLGSTVLTSANLSAYAGQIAQWNDSLSTDADLLFYGCNLASTDDGRELLQSLSAICDCDVAASEDVTGHEDQGGDWSFEYAVGTITTKVAVSEELIASWGSTLDITSNLALHNTFDVDASDSSGNNYNGALSNGASIDSTLATNQIGVGKASLDGDDDYIDVSAHVSNFDGVSQGTIAAWIYADTATPPQVIFQSSDSGDTDSRVVLLRDTDGSLNFYINEDTTAHLHVQTAAGAIPTGTWTHIAVTVDASGNTLYINGVEQTTGLIYTHGTTATNSFFDDVTQLDFLGWGVDHWGSSNFSNQFNGFIDDARIYDRALTASDVSELFNYTGASPQTFVVTNTNDSGAGSLRQAILDANANSDVLDTVEFNISGSGPHTISPLSFLPFITDPIFIDGWSESDYAGDGVPVIVLDGSLAGPSDDGLDFDNGSDGSIARGLSIVNFTENGIELNSNNSWIYGNYVGVQTDGVTLAGNAEDGVLIFNDSTNNRIGTDGDGSNDAFERNIIGGNTNGITIDGNDANGNSVSGNYIGVGADGETVLANTGNGVFLNNGPDTNTIGGSTAALRNVIAGNDNDGVRLFGAITTMNIIQGNYIGVSADGSTNLGNGGDGIFIFQGGDDTLITDNLIAGSSFVGIEIDGASNNTLIQGNTIGTDATGTLDWGNKENGILFENGPTNTTVGGTNAGEGNVIAFNSLAGVQVEAGSTGIEIRGNSIYSNNGVGIDLTAGTVPDGATANDAGDIDSGANTLQNWAILNSAGISDAGVFSFELDTNTLNAAAYEFDFFASSNRNGGEVEARRYLGTWSAVTGGAIETETLPGVVAAPGEYVTAVTTNALTQNSSEISNYTVLVDTDASGATPKGLQTTATIDGGFSLNHDGGNDTYLIADDGGAVLGGLTSLTFESRLNLHSVGSSTALVSYFGAANDAFRVNLESGGDLSLRVQTGAAITADAIDYASTLADGNPHTISVTWDNSGSASIYIDGGHVETVSGLGVGATLDSTGILLIGQEQDSLEGDFDTNQTLSATLFDVRFFDKVRTAGEIAANYRVSLPFDEVGMIANWRFDQLSPDEIVTDAINANNLTVRHTSESGFTFSDPALTLSVDENALDGTLIGTVEGFDAEREAAIASLLSANTNLYYNAETHSFYEYVDTGMDWSTANLNALSSSINGVAGQLVVIDSATENQQIVDILNDHSATQAYFAANDAAVEGEWRWGTATGSVQFWAGDGNGYNVAERYHNWDPGNPNDFGSNQDYAKIFASTGLWDDVDGTTNHKSIIEYDADQVLDATGNALDYTITSQSVAGAFAIDNDTGDIFVLDGTLLDADAQANHTITVEVEDAAGNTQDADFVVSLNNLVEANNAPSDLSSGIELNMDGGNDAYLEAANGSAVFNNLTEVTFETVFQIEKPNTATNAIISYSNGLQHNEFYLTINADGQLWLGIDSIGTGELGSVGRYTELLDGNIHHLAVTWDSTNGEVAFYIDGKLAEAPLTYKQGATIASGGTLQFGQDQDLTGYEANQAFSGTFFDLRIWDEVRSAADIALNHRQKLDVTPAEAAAIGLVANWQMEFNGSNQVVDIVSEPGTPNRLSIGHATGTGFATSDPAEDLHVLESAANGTRVGFVLPQDQDLHNDIINDGTFTEALPSGSTQLLGTAATFGPWEVESGSVQSLGGWHAQSPLGGVPLELGAGSPGTIKQTLATEVGRTYQVTFALSGDWSAGDHVKDVRVSAAGISEDFQITMPTAWSAATPLWEHRSVSFTAAESSTDLRFTSLDGSPTQTAVISDVQVFEIPQAVNEILNDDSTLKFDPQSGKFYRVSSVTSSGVNINNTVGDEVQGGVLNAVVGNLATIRSAAENYFLRQLLTDAGRSGAWIGASDAAIEGTWTWQDGSNDSFYTGGGAVAGAYENFGTFEPSGGLSENYGELVAVDGTWNDLGGSSFRHWITEWNASEVLASFTFDLTDDANGRFVIDGSTGEITVADTSQLDHETNTSHNVTVQVTDAADNAYSEVMSITIDDAFEISQTVPGAQVTSQDTPLVFTGPNAIFVSDGLASANTRLQTYISTNFNGTLTLSQTTGLYIGGGSNGGTFMTIQGTESDINAAFDGMTFTPAAGYSGPVTINMTTSMGADLKGRYEFEGDANDTGLGLVQHGALNGATITPDGTRGQVLLLDAAGEHVEVPGRFSQPTNLTLSAWVNLDSGIVDGEVISLGNNVMLRADDSAKGLSILYYQGSGVWNDVSAVDVNLDGAGWHHIATSFDDTNNRVAVYLDGIEVASAITADSIDWTDDANTTTNTFIGMHGGGSTAFDFQGMIDSARIYDRALSAGEVAALANEQTEVPDTVAITVNANSAPVINQTNLLTNGDLETGDLTGWSTTGTVTTNGVALRFGEFDAAAPHTASQSFTTTIGQTYTLKFDFRDDSNIANQTMQVTVDGAINNLDVTQSTSVGSISYRSYVYSFVADSTTTTLTFTDVSPSSSTVDGFIDNVAVIERPTLTAISEDAVNNAGDTVASILSSVSGDLVTDTDIGALEGIALTEASSAFDYSTDGGATWQRMRGLSTFHALLLRSTDLLRFVPNEIATQNEEIEFRAWDQTTGAVGDYVSTSTNGGSTAFSTQIEIASIVTTDINDAPSFGSEGGFAVGYGQSGYNQNAASLALSDGSVLFTPYDESFNTVIGKLGPDGQLDTSFGVDGYFAASSIQYIRDIKEQPDGKFLVTGDVGADIGLARYNADGTLDAGFGTGGIIVTDINGTDDAYEVAVHTDGSIAVVGSANSDSLVARYTSAGVLDVNFDSDGIATVSLDAGSERLGSVTFLTDGSILAAGESHVVRFTTTGLDTTFDGDGTLDVGHPANSLVVQANGDIAVAGFLGENAVVTRFDSDGNLDTGFGVGGTATWNDPFVITSFSNKIIQQSDGKLLIAATAETNSSFGYEMAVVRLNTDGSLDMTFGTNGSWLSGITNDYADGYDVSLYDDGGQEKIIVGGYESQFGFSRATVARLNANGTLDSSYQSGLLDGNPTFIEDGAAVILDDNAQVFDRELSKNDDFTGATLSLSRSGGANSNDLFSATGNLVLNAGTLELDSTNVGIYTNAGGQLDLTFGNAVTNEQVNEVVQSIAYSNASQNPAASVDLNWTFNDGNAGAQGSGGALDISQNMTVNISQSNDLPVLLDGNELSNARFDGGLSDWTVTGNTDWDSGQQEVRFGQIGGANGAISQTFATSVGETYYVQFDYGDKSVTQSQSLNVAVDGSTSLLNADVLSSNVNAVLQPYTFRFVADSTSTTITFTDTSASHSGVRGYLDNTEVRSSATPILGTMAYTEGDAATVLHNWIPIADLDDTHLESAVVEITGNYENGEDVLAATDQFGITSTWNAGTGQLTLTGSSFVSNYEVVLRSVTYANASHAPTESTRTITYTVNDGNGDSNIHTRNVDVVAVNDEPAFSNLDANPTFTENSPTPITLDSDVTIFDEELSAADNFSGSTIYIGRSGGASSDDQFVATGLLGPLTESGNAVYNGTTIGTVTQNSGGALIIAFNSNPTRPMVNSVLQSIGYSNTDDVPPNSVQLTWTFNDANFGPQGTGGALFDSGTMTVNITPFNDPATVSTNTGITVLEGGSVAITSANLNEGDPDDDGANVVYRVRTDINEGSLSLNGTALEQNDTFTQADIDGGLVSYTHAGGQDNTEVINLAINDVGNAGETNLSIAVSVTPVNDAPAAADDPAGTIDLASDPDTVGFWRLGEPSGATAIDAAGSNDGTYNNVALNALGAIAGDTAGDFSGSNSYVNLGNLEVTGTGLTMAAWINADSFGGGDGRIIAKSDGTANLDHTWMLSVVDVGPNVFLRLRVSAGNHTELLITEAPALATGQWYHVAGTYDQATREMAIYVDGNLVELGQHTVGGAVDQDPAREVWIGGNPAGGNFFDGRIDEALIAQRALTAGEVTALADRSPPDYSVAENATLTISAVNGVLHNDSDVEGDTLTVTEVDGVSASVGNQIALGSGALLTLNSDGSFDYAPNNQFESLGVGQSASDTFNYTTTDGNGGTDAATATVTITGANDAPTLAAITGDTLLYAEGDGAVVIDQASPATVSDVDSPNFDAGDLQVFFFSGSDPAEDILSVRDQGTGSGQIGVSGSNVTYGGTTIGNLTGGTGGANLQINLNANANAAAVSALLQNVTFENTNVISPTTGNRLVHFRVNDGDGGSSLSYVASVNVNSVNDAPFTGTATTTGNEDAAFIPLTLGGSDSDGTIENFVLSSLPANGTLYTDVGRTNAATTGTDIAATGETLTLYFVPNADWNGTTNFNYAAKDDGGLLDPTDATATITVDSVNDAPTIATNNPLNILEGNTGQTITTTLLNEGDVDDDGTEVTYRVTTPPANGVLRLSGTAISVNGTFTQDDIDNNRVTYDHDGSESPADSFVFDVSDGGEDGATPLTDQTFSISITGSNDAPVLLNNDITLLEGEQVTLNSTILSASDNDDVDSSLTFTVSSVSGGHFAYNTTPQATITSFTQGEVTAGIVAFVHDGGEAAPSYDVSVSDGTLSDIGSAAITFSNVNDAPSINSLGGDSVAVPNDGTVVRLDVGSQAHVVDSDSPPNYDGASLSIQGVGFDSFDTLGVDTSGPIDLPSGLSSGGAVVFGGTQVGTIAAGVTNDSIVINFNSAATHAEIETILQSLTFASSSGTLGLRAADVMFVDGDGTVNGGMDASQVATIQIALADAAGGLVTTNEDTTYTFTASDFDFTGITGGGLTSLTVTNLPANGSLELNGSAVSVNDTISRAELDAGNLTFDPDANENGPAYASFDFYLNNGKSTVSVLAGEPNLYTLGGGQLPATDEILASSANFGAGGTVSTGISVVAGSNTIDATYLSQGQIFFSGFLADGTYTGAELAELDTWVQAGGILIATTDDPGFDDVASFYGLTVTGAGNATWNVANGVHPIMNGPFGSVGSSISATGSIGYFTTGSLLPGDTILATDSVNGSPTVVLRAHGGGHILFTSDEGIFRANMTGGGAISTPNDILAANVFAWAVDQIAPNDMDTVNISVSAVNDAPFGTGGLPNDVAATEDMSSNVDLSPINLFDVDSAAGELTFTLSTSAGGTLSATTGGGVTVGGSGSSTLTLDSTLANLNAFIDSPTNIQYLSALDVNGSAADTIQMRVTDNGNVGAGGGGTINLGSVNVNISAVNDTPNVTPASAIYNVNEQTNLSIEGTGFSVSDIDAAGGTMTATLAVGEGTITVTAGNSGVVITGGNSSDTVTVTGSQTQINNLLTGTSTGTITYFNGNDLPSATTTFTVTVNDNGNSGLDPGLTADPASEEASASQTINIIAVNDAPIIDLDADDSAGTPGADFTATYSAGSANAPLVDGSFLDDVDQTLQSLSVQITNNMDGTLEGIGATTPGSIATTYNPATATYTFTDAGGATNADFRAVLDSLTYFNLLTAPDTTTRVITITASDGIDSASATAFVNIIGDTNGPTAVNNTGGNANEGGQSVIDNTELQFTDLQPATQVEYNVTSPTTNGFLSLVSNPSVAVSSFTQADIDTGSLVYTHDGSETTADSFAFSVDDGLGNVLAGQTFNIAVQPTNDSPINTVPGPQNVAEDGVLLFAASNLNPISIADVDAGTSAVQVTISVGNGTLTLTDTSPLTFTVGDGLADGTMTFSGSITDTNAALDGLTYTPTPDFSGTDTLVVASSDLGNSGLGGPRLDSDSILITIANVNDAPTLTASATGITANENAAARAFATDTFTDIDSPNLNGGSLTFTVTSTPDASGERLSLTSIGGVATTNGGNVLVGGVNIGTITGLETSGPMRINFNANATPSTAETLLQAFMIRNVSEDPVTGIRTIEVNATDGDGGTSAPVSTDVDFLSTNDAPVSNDDFYATNEDQLLSVTLPANGLLLNDSDAEGHLLTVNTSPVAGPTNGALVISSDGTFSYQPDLNFNGTDSFIYEVTDGNGGTGQATVTVAVAPINDAPVAANDAYAISEDTTLTTTLGVSGLLQNDIDVDGDPLTLNSIPVIGPSHGILVLNADGTFTYTPNPNFNGADSFTYMLTDPAGDSDTATVDISIAAVNDAPVVTTNTGATVTEGGNVSLGSLELLAVDVDNAPSQLTFSVTTNPAHGQLELANAPGIAITTFTQADLDNDSLVYVHDGSETTSDSFSFQLDDGGPTTVSGTFSIAVLPSNDAPITASEAFSLNEGGTVASAAPGLLANDFDPEFDTLTATLVSGPAHGTLQLNPDGSFIYTHDGGESTNDQFVYAVNDGNGGSTQATVLFAIRPVNDAPIGTDDAYITSFGQTLNVGTANGLLANDTDAEGSPLSANLIYGPANGTLTMTPDGAFTYVPDLNFSGTDSFTYEVTDGSSTSSAVTVLIDVLPVPPGGGGPGDTGGGDTGGGDGTNPGDGDDDSSDPNEEQDEDNNPNPVGTPSANPTSRDDHEHRGQGVSGELENEEELTLVNLVETNRVQYTSYTSQTDTIARIKTEMQSAIQILTNIDVDLQNYVVDSNIVWENFNKLRHQVEDDIAAQRFAIGSATALGGALSFGYMVWTVRGGFLLASFASSLPAWRLLDPLPVLRITAPASESVRTRKDKSLAELAASTNVFKDNKQS